MVSRCEDTERETERELGSCGESGGDVCVGLGYGSGSESDDEREVDDSPSPAAGRDLPADDSSDDDELRNRIRHKKTEFERKMRELEERENGERTCLCIH